MKKRLCVFLLVFATSIQSTLAQTLQESVERAAVELAAQQTPSQSATSHNRWLVPGLALIGVGGGLAILGATALKRGTPASDICRDLNQNFGLSQGNCDDLKESNKPLIIGGAAIAGVGAALLIVGAHHAVVIHPERSGGVSITHAVTF